MRANIWWSQSKLQPVTKTSQKTLVVHRTQTKANQSPTWFYFIMVIHNISCSPIISPTLCVPRQRGEFRVSLAKHHSAETHPSGQSNKQKHSHIFEIINQICLCTGRVYTWVELLGSRQMSVRLVLCSTAGLPDSGKRTCSFIEAIKYRSPWKSVGILNCYKFDIQAVWISANSTEILRNGG